MPSWNDYLISLIAVLLWSPIIITYMVVALIVTVITVPILLILKGAQYVSKRN